jgi:hypothetical protein
MEAQRPTWQLMALIVSKHLLWVLDGCGDYRSLLCLCVEVEIPW